MKQPPEHEKVLVSAKEDAHQSKGQQAASASYRLAYIDEMFMMRDELRSVRLQMEWLKPELTLNEHDIVSTVVIFGGARFPERDRAERSLAQAEQALADQPNDPRLTRQRERARNILANSRFYDAARELARRITEHSLSLGGNEYVVVTGGGPGIMEAANRGAAEAGGKTIGFNIVLPFEQQPNPWITPDLCFQFHYFALRKMHFLIRAQALVACPGGYGTLDELFETLTLIQTGKVKAIPVILIGSDYWRRLIDFEFLAEQGAVADEDLELFHIVDSAEEAWQALKQCW